VPFGNPTRGPVKKSYAMLPLDLASRRPPVPSGRCARCVRMSSILGRGLLAGKAVILLASVLERHRVVELGTGREVFVAEDEVWDLGEPVRGYQIRADDLDVALDLGEVAADVLHRGSIPRLRCPAVRQPRCWSVRSGGILRRFGSLPGLADRGTWVQFFAPLRTID
jgi:hypothetical protein